MPGDGRRYRVKLRDRDRSVQEQLQTLTRQLEHLQVDNKELALRQRRMTDLIDHQEFHISILINKQVSMFLSAQHKGYDVFLYTHR